MVHMPESSAHAVLLLASSRASSNAGAHAYALRRLQWRAMATGHRGGAPPVPRRRPRFNEGVELREPITQQALRVCACTHRQDLQRADMARRAAVAAALLLLFSVAAPSAHAKIYNSRVELSSRGLVPLTESFGFADGGQLIFTLRDLHMYREHAGSKDQDSNINFSKSVGCKWQGAAACCRGACLVPHA